MEQNFFTDKAHVSITPLFLLFLSHFSQCCPKKDQRYTGPDGILFFQILLVPVGDQVLREPPALIGPGKQELAQRRQLMTGSRGGRMQGCQARWALQERAIVVCEGKPYLFIYFIRGKLT